MGSQMTPSHLTLSDLEKSKSRFICHERAKIGHILLVNLHRKPYVVNPMV